MVSDDELFREFLTNDFFELPIQQTQTKITNDIIPEISNFITDIQFVYKNNMFHCPYKKCNIKFHYKESMQQHINISHLKLRYQCESCNFPKNMIY